MTPIGDVDVTAHGFARTMTTQLSVGHHLTQVACGGGLGDTCHLDVFLRVQPTEKATIAVIKQALQDFALAFVQRTGCVRFPKAPFEDSLVDDCTGGLASRCPLMGKPLYP